MMMLVSWWQRVTKFSLQMALFKGLCHVQSSVLLRLHGLVTLDVQPLKKKLLYFIELLLLALRSPPL